MNSLKLATTLFLLFIIICTQAQTVKTFAGKPYTGSGFYNGTRNNHKDSMLFSAPNGIAVDTAGRIYISNEQNIMMITGTNCKLVAGYNLDPNQPGAADSKDGTGPSARFSNPAGLCVYPATNEILVADVDNNQIRKVSPFFNLTQDPAVTTVAGVKLLLGDYLDSSNLLSKFYAPVGVAIAANGDIYIADRNNHCIRKISGGNVTTIGGISGVQSHVNGVNGTSTFSAPYNLCINGNILYVADYGNSAIRKIDLSTNITTDFITSGLFAPTDLCIVDNTFYITEQTSVKKFENNVLSIYAGSSAQSGNMDGDGSNARFESLSGIAYSKTLKLLYVVDKGNNVIKTIAPNNKPICSFTASNVAPTVGQTVILKNTSDNKPLNFKWTITPSNYNLLNNSKLTDSFIYVNFSLAGSFTVKLWVSNTGGADSLLKNNYITVSAVTAAPIVDFIASKTNPITNEIISLIDQSANDPTTWKWRISPLTYIFTDGTDSSSRIPHIKFTNGDNYNVTLIASNAQGSNSLTKTSYINVNQSSVHSVAFKLQLNIFPNPTNNFVNLLHPLNGTVRLMDIEGKVLDEWTKENEKLLINLKNFTSGIYFLMLQTNEGIISKKIIISH